jgi:hypothetical protein
MAPTSEKKALYAAADKLPKSPPVASITPNNIEVSAEEADEAAVFRDTFLRNLKSRTPDLEKRPLILLLKQKNMSNGRGWLRKALYPGISRPLSDSEMVPFLLLSASLIGTNLSAKIVAYACGLSDTALRSKWGPALSIATNNKIDCSEPTTSRAAQLLPASSSSSGIAQAADERLGVKSKKRSAQEELN